MTASFQIFSIHHSSTILPLIYSLKTAGIIQPSLFTPKQKILLMGWLTSRMCSVWISQGTKVILWLRLSVVFLHLSGQMSGYNLDQSITASFKIIIPLFILPFNSQHYPALYMGNLLNRSTEWYTLLLLGHWLPWLRLFVVFVSAPGKCQDSALIMLWLFPSKFFPILHSCNILPINTIQSTYWLHH
jgi:hypothetical protein